MQTLVAFNKIICLSKSNQISVNISRLLIITTYLAVFVDIFSGVSTKKYVKNLFAESISKLKMLFFSLFEPLSTTSILKVLKIYFKTCFPIWIRDRRKMAQT